VEGCSSDAIPSAPLDVSFTSSIDLATRSIRRLLIVGTSPVELLLVVRAIDRGCCCYCASVERRAAVVLRSIDDLRRSKIRANERIKSTSPLIASRAYAIIEFVTL
jgi:hypothetical protein